MSSVRLTNIIIFLCANQDMLNLLPLTPSRPNPAGLTWDEYSIELYPSRPADETAEAEKHPPRFLPASSLVKVLLLCTLFLPPSHQRLCRYLSWILRELGIFDDEHGHFGASGCPALNALWLGYWKVLRVPTDKAVQLRSAAQSKQWRQRIFNGGGMS